ncbi:MAG: hypothetical protein JHD02_08790, partial [Thermoleophilaceae bacterium]|nr:hypothetical protein [Thermoleophilaceae bacterium]
MRRPDKDLDIRLALRTLVVLATLAVVLSSAASAGAAPGRVVALGDSLASGTNLGPRVPGSILACGQSTGSYVELARSRLQPSSWANATCNGGHSGLFTYGWGGLAAAPEWLQENDGTMIPPQFDSLRGDEQAVIVGTGNNEAYFGEVIGACLGHVPSLTAYNAGLPPINNCKNTYVNSGGYNRLIEKATNSESLVGPALDQIHTRAPNAKVFLVGLPRVVTADGVGCMPNPILTTADAPVYAVWEDQLRLAMKRVVASRTSFASFVDMQAISGSSHTSCAAWGQKWINPWSVEPGLTYPGMTVHNTPAGANAIANAIIDSFKAAGLDTGSIAVNPVVNITSPANNQVFTTTPVTVAYTATDNVGIESCNRANNSQVALTPGLNTITVTCFDFAGNSGSKSVNVTLNDTTKPVVTINTPTPNQVFTSSTATLSYSASDNIGVTSCTRANNSSVALAPGPNTITVSCSDGSGNSASASVNVTYNDTTKPVVTINTP